MFSLLTNMKLSLFVVFGSLYFLQFASFVSSKTNDFKSAIEARINIVNNSGSTIKRLHELSNNLNNNSWTPGFPQTNPGSNTNPGTNPNSPGTNPNSPAATYLDIQNAMYILDKLLNALNSRPSANSPAAYAVRDRIRALIAAINQPNSALTLDQIQFAIITMVLAVQTLPYEQPVGPVPNLVVPVGPVVQLATPQEIQNAMSQLNNLLNQLNAKSPVSANDPAANAVRSQIQNLQNQLAQNPPTVTNDQLNTALTGINQAVAAVPTATPAGATAQEIQNALSQLNNLLAQVNAVSPVSANDPAANAVRQSIQALITALGQPNSALTSPQIEGAIAQIIQSLQQVQAPAANTPLERVNERTNPTNLPATAQEIQDALALLTYLLNHLNDISPPNANDPTANQIRDSIQTLQTALNQPNSALTGTQINGAISTIISALQSVTAPAATLRTPTYGVKSILRNELNTLGLGVVNAPPCGG